jgi:uncharacterized protein DUF6892
MRPDRCGIAKGWSVNSMIDQAALASLRPGMPVCTLRAICGPHWEQLKPDRDGWVVKLADVGFVARIGADGNIGRVGFSNRFPAASVVDMLHIGMNIDAALAAYPTLRHVEDVTVSAATLRRFGAIRPDGIRIEARFRDGRLLAFDLDRPDAIYGAAPSDETPASVATADHFADPNFKLVVLDALLTAKAIDLGSERKLASDLMGPTDDRSRFRKPVYDYLVRYPLTVDQLGVVEELVFDSDNDIYFYVFPNWGGDGNAFDVESLEGIEQLPNLRSVNAISMLADDDLSHLAGLAKLEILRLPPMRFRNAPALLALPRLKTLDCFADSSLPDATITAALEAKGVKVTAYH